MWLGELQECFYQKAIHRLRPKDDSIAPELMLRFMRYKAETGGFRYFTSQTSIAHLTREKLAVLPVPVPLVAEQERLVGRFDSMDAALAAERRSLEKLAATKLGLMQDLLTGKVRVKVAGQRAHV